MALMQHSWEARQFAAGSGDLCGFLSKDITLVCDDKGHILVSLESQP